MENTEDILKKVIYLKGYYYSQLSLFPNLNHCKNHFYFEMMKDEYTLASGEWFIPIGWERGTLDSVMEEKALAVKEAEEALEKLIALEVKISEDEYKNLYTKFKNLELVTKIWEKLTHLFYNYAKFFEKKDEKYEAAFFENISSLEALNYAGKVALGDDFYCISGDSLVGSGRIEMIDVFLREVMESFEAEKAVAEKFDLENLYDYVIPGGASEGHALKKEVNFSATAIKDGELHRIPGSPLKGWSIVNAHGWFSYALKVRPNAENTIIIDIGSPADTLDAKITVGEKSEELHLDGSRHTLTYTYKAGCEESVRVRFDRISANAPEIYAVKVK
jgi:hypothetical protein